MKRKMKKNSLRVVLTSLFLLGLWLVSTGDAAAQKVVIADRTADYAVGSGAEFSAFDGTHVWVANQFSNTVSKLNISSGSVVGDYPLTGNPLGIAYDGRSIWVSRFAANDVVALDPATGRVIVTVKTDKGPGFLLYSGNSIWVANRLASSVQKINASSGQIEGTYKVGKRPAMMASDGTNVWVANSQSRSVSRINAAGVKEFSVAAGGAGAFGVAFDGTNVWVSNFFGGSIMKLSPEGTALAVYKVGDGLAGMYYLNQHMWVVANGDNMVYRVRLSDGVIVNRYQVSASPYGILFDGNRFWTQASGAGRVSAVTPAIEDEAVIH
jgi:YVTN family beta-propeller protein